MNIALIGYGKMGKAIEEIALQKGHNVVLKIDDQNLNDLTKENLRKADVAIEFTMPQSAVANILQCFDAGLPVVCGTTGWLEQKNFIEEKCKKANGTFLTTTNFSIGVNIFFELNKKLAMLMKPHTNYEIEIEEVHHEQKKDAPSGTAITLAEGVIENSPVKNKWANEFFKNKNTLSIISKRIDAVPGTHIVKYTSEVDDIEIVHTAHNRKGFAAGALMAAEFIHGKKGIFSMKDVLGL
ncbi:MAG: 4-hydroxy-tetrahydrodipicolinate reductase [Bacteroidota bacterium]|nr:4-hydroxy-tetrahydrodipicolinate reductase [Bacteroidota bacterium]